MEGGEAHILKKLLSVRREDRKIFINLFIWVSSSPLLSALHIPTIGPVVMGLI